MAEKQGCQLVHAVPVQARIKRIRHQHRVIDADKIDPVLAHHQLVEFDVLADFQNRRVFQQRFEQRQRLVMRHLSGHTLGPAKQIARPFPDMAERDITGLIGGGGQRDADKIGTHRIKPAGLGVKGHETGLIGAGNPVFQRLC